MLTIAKVWPGCVGPPAGPDLLLRLPAAASPPALISRPRDCKKLDPFSVTGESRATSSEVCEKKLLHHLFHILLSNLKQTYKKCPRTGSFSYLSCIDTQQHDDTT